MSAINKFSGKLETDTTITDPLHKGAFNLSAFAQINQIQKTATFENQERIYKFWKVDQEYPRGPLPFFLKVIDVTDFDVSNIDNDSPAILSDTLIGITKITLPQFQYSKTLITDILSASLIYIKQGQYDIAYAFLQTAYLFISLYGNNFPKRSKHDDYKIFPGEL